MCPKVATLRKSKWQRNNFNGADTVKQQTENIQKLTADTAGLHQTTSFTKYYKAENSTVIIDTLQPSRKNK